MLARWALAVPNELARVFSTVFHVEAWRPPWPHHSAARLGGGFANAPLQPLRITTPSSSTHHA